MISLNHLKHNSRSFSHHLTSDGLKLPMMKLPVIYANEKRDWFSAKIPQAKWVTGTVWYRSDWRVSATTTFAQSTRSQKRHHLVTTSVLRGGLDWEGTPPESALVTMYLPAGASKDLSVVKHQGPEEELREQKDRVTWTNFPKAPLPKIAIPYPWTATLQSDTGTSEAVLNPIATFPYACERWGPVPYLPSSLDWTHTGQMAS